MAHVSSPGGAVKAAAVPPTVTSASTASVMVRNVEPGSEKRRRVGDLSVGCRTDMALHRRDLVRGRVRSGSDQDCRSAAPGRQMFRAVAAVIATVVPDEALVSSTRARRPMRAGRRSRVRCPRRAERPWLTKGSRAVAAWSGIIPGPESVTVTTARSLVTSGETPIAPGEACSVVFDIAASSIRRSRGRSASVAVDRPDVEGTATVPRAAARFVQSLTAQSSQSRGRCSRNDVGIGAPSAPASSTSRCRSSGELRRVGSNRREIEAVRLVERCWIGEFEQAEDGVQRRGELVSELGEEALLGLHGHRRCGEQLAQLSRSLATAIPAAGRFTCKVRACLARRFAQPPHGPPLAGVARRSRRAGSGLVVVDLAVGFGNPDVLHRADSPLMSTYMHTVVQLLEACCPCQRSASARARARVEESPRSGRRRPRSTANAEHQRRIGQNRIDDVVGVLQVALEASAGRGADAGDVAAKRRGCGRPTRSVSLPEQVGLRSHLTDDVVRFAVWIVAAGVGATDADRSTTSSRTSSEQHLADDLLDDVEQHTLRSCSYYWFVSLMASIMSRPLISSPMFAAWRVNWPGVRCLDAQRVIFTSAHALNSRLTDQQALDVEVWGCLSSEFGIVAR